MVELNNAVLELLHHARLGDSSLRGSLPPRLGRRPQVTQIPAKACQLDKPSEPRQGTCWGLRAIPKEGKKVDGIDVTEAALPTPDNLPLGEFTQGAQGTGHCSGFRRCHLVRR